MILTNSPAVWKPSKAHYVQQTMVLASFLTLEVSVFNLVYLVSHNANSVD